MTNLTSVQQRITQIQGMLARVEGKDTTTTASGTGASTATTKSFGASLAGATGTSGATGKGAQVVKTAEQYLGVPYVYGGNEPSTGLDCSGLTKYVYQQFGIDLPRGSIAQAETGTPVASIADAKPGDLVFTYGDPDRTNGHVGIYVGDGKWIAAPYTGEVVKIENVPTEITAIRREVS
ncbi:MAG: C40 family peptidase [Acidimicrobiia bacterium]